MGSNISEVFTQESFNEADHVHMMVSIPPKYAVSQVVGSGIYRYIKGKKFIS